MHPADVADWRSQSLSSYPAADEVVSQSFSTYKKRPRASSLPSSPPALHIAMASPSTPSKKKLRFDDDSNSNTPSTTRSSTTRKRLFELDIDDNGIETRDLMLSSDGLPAKLRTMLEKVIKLGTGVGVVSAMMKVRFYFLTFVFLTYSLLAGYQ